MARTSTTFVPTEFDPEEVRAKIIEHRGNLYQVGRHFGCQARTIKGWLDRHPDVMGALITARLEAPPQNAWDEDPEVVSAEIRALNGNLGAVCRRFNVSRHTLQSYIERHPDVQTALYEAREEMLDVGEASLFNRVIAGDAWAVCCAEGTLITTAKGDTTIESVLPGDMVLTPYGFMRRVLGISSRHYAGPIITLGVHAYVRPLRVTPEHPILSVLAAGAADDIAFRAAGTLRAGNCVHIVSWNAFIALQSWSATPYDGNVFNLQVETDESYVAEGISVHNCFFLKTQGRKRGYIERGETFNLNVNLEKCSIEQLERIAAGEHPSLVLGAPATQSRTGSEATDPLTIEGTSSVSAEEETDG